MLRRLEIKTAHRSLAPGFWPSAIAFGKHTVIYGHNGSGKSTLAHLLLALADGDAPMEVTWQSEDGRTSKVQVGSGLPGGTMAVFTKDWVDRNLHDFLEGDSATAIVTLGEAAIGAKEEEDRLAEEIERFVGEEKEAERTRNELKRKLTGFEEEARDAIYDQLRRFDYERFSKGKWSVRKMKTELSGYTGNVPATSDSVDALARLAEGALDAVPAVTSPPAAITAALQSLEALLRETPTRVAIAKLESNPTAQTWVEEGMLLHRDQDICMFCDGQLSESRRDELGKHFDESWFDIRGRTVSLVQQLTIYREALRTWLAGLPEATALASELQGTYSAQLEVMVKEVEERLVVLDDVMSLAQEKQTDPSATPTLPDCNLLTTPLSTSALVGAVREHNEQAGAQTERTEQHYDTVVNNIIGSRSGQYKEFAERLETAETKVSDAAGAVRLARRTLDEVKQRKFSSHKMAKTLTADLARVYGKHHLSVSVTSDGKSYACKRGNEPATNLSTGERTTLSLLYFLRKLEDETESANSTERIVVVDDPSSSLDREAVFATHQWLIDTLRPFGQYVVLTHDFNLLRLFIKSQTSQWNKSIGALNKGDDLKEAMFPRVAFLEMYAATDGDGRTSKLAELPRMLKENTSEYAYLFNMVMRGVREGADSDQLFLLPNAARRLLEVFCSFKVPDRPNFDDQLKELVAGDSGPEPYRDVYDFCQRRSHGEGPEVVDAMDGRAVHDQLKRCMAFLKHVDEDHYKRMCKAVKCDAELV